MRTDDYLTNEASSSRRRRRRSSRYGVEFYVICKYRPRSVRSNYGSNRNLPNSNQGQGRSREYIAKQKELLHSLRPQIQYTNLFDVVDVYIK